MLKTRRVAAILLAAAMAATACGGSSPIAASDATIDVRASTTDAMPALVLTSELDTTQMFDTRTNDITSLGQVVAGDRPVLLWYWAPN